MRKAHTYGLIMCIAVFASGVVYLRDRRLYEEKKRVFGRIAECHRVFDLQNRKIKDGAVLDGHVFNMEDIEEKYLECNEAYWALVERYNNVPNPLILDMKPYPTKYDGYRM